MIETLNGKSVRFAEAREIRIGDQILERYDDEIMKKRCLDREGIEEIFCDG